MINLRFRSTSRKPVKCTHAPIVYVSNYSWHSNNNFCGSAQTHVPKLTRWCSRPCHIIYFEGRSLILVPNIRQEKRYFCVLVCCTCSAMYLAGRHLKKSRKLDLNWKFYAPKRISYAQRRKVLINITKSIPKASNISKCRPSKYRVVVQEKISGSTSLLSYEEKCSIIGFLSL